MEGEGEEEEEGAEVVIMTVVDLLKIQFPEHQVLIHHNHHSSFHKVA